MTNAAVQHKSTLWTRLLWSVFASGLLGSPAEMWRFRCINTEDSRTEQGGKPSPPQCFGLIKVVWEPPGPNNTSAEDAQGLTKWASNQCEAHLKLGFQSIRSTLFCAPSKNCLSIIGLSILSIFQLYVSFTQLFFFILILSASMAQAFPKRVLLEKEFIPAYLPHLQLLYHCLEPEPKQCKGRKG